MSYHIPVSGLSTEPNNGSWAEYWATMPDFERYDCFAFSSADFHNPLYARFDPVTGIPIESFKQQVEAQTMKPVSMGLFYSSRVVQDRYTNQLYLNVSQTGCGVYFKLYPQ